MGAVSGQAGGGMILLAFIAGALSLLAAAILAFVWIVREILR